MLAEVAGGFRGGEDAGNAISKALRVVWDLSGRLDGGGGLAIGTEP
ncbi:hypothetical protein [Methanoculleus chikugoensis]|nr:hypothetical protein [Methanoculleus chikugoensis]